MIRAENLSVTYPNGVTALHPTNLDVEAGRFIVLLGPSGAGKSSLLRCLNGLVRPSVGDIARPAAARSSHRARGCGTTGAALAWCSSTIT